MVIDAMLSVQMTPQAKVSFEEQCFFHASGLVVAPINVGAFSYFGANCMLGGFTMGRFCSVAPGVKIGLGEHETGYFSTHPFFFGSKNGFKISDGIGMQRDLSQQKHGIPRIGHDVWIGANAVIRRGITIGTGAVIAAGAIVTKNVEPYSIVGGVSAKHLGYRFEESIIKELLDSQWWEYDLSSFIGLDTRTPTTFLEQFNAVKDIKKASYKRFTILPSGEIVE